MERAIRGFHQGQQSLTAPTGRTHDRTRPIEVMLGVTSRNLSKESADAALLRGGVSVGLTPEAG
jgi:hypothetical protein